jgi:hypothetical protein
MISTMSRVAVGIADDLFLERAIADPLLWSWGISGAKLQHENKSAEASVPRIFLLRMAQD